MLAAAMMSAADKVERPFHVPLGLRLFGTFAAHFNRLLIATGNLETSFLTERLSEIEIDRPIYVAGLARSGSTILLEILASADGVVTHRYNDYPPLFVPYFWNLLLRHLPKKQLKPVERTHLDGLMITPESPEAFEEVIWMTFFPALHQPGATGLLDARTDNPTFERFYREHVRKLMYVRGGNRYASKGNYNVTRFNYLSKLFPDARFVLPIREPTGHIASLMKQHALFTKGEQGNPHMLAHLRRIGHFEFGMDRRPSNAGNAAAISEVDALWQAGEEVRGWARYWRRLYQYLADALDRDRAFKEAAIVVRFEDLCASPESTVRTLMAHCQLPGAERLAAQWTGRLRYPTYYEPSFSVDDRAIIAEETAEIAEIFGYGPSRH